MPVYCSVLLALRVFLKRATLGIDDTLIVIATFFQCGQAAAIFLALKKGAGTAFNIVAADDSSTISTAIYAANILFIASLALSKASVICLLMRLFNLAYNKVCHASELLFHRKICLSALALTGLWAIASIVGVSVDCEADSFVVDAQSCPRQGIRWVVIMAIDSFLELSIVVITIINVLPLQLSKAMKTQIIISFAFRLPCIVFSVLHYRQVVNYTEDSDDGLKLALVLDFMQLDICYSLISATIPSLKAFVKSFNSGFGMGLDVATAYFGTAGSGRLRDYELSQMKSQQTSELQETGSDDIRLRQPASASSLESEMNGRDGKRSFASHDSQAQIIRKDVHWTIDQQDN